LQCASDSNLNLDRTSKMVAVSPAFGDGPTPAVTARVTMARRPGSSSGRISANQHQYCATGGCVNARARAAGSQAKERQDDWTNQRSEHTKGHGAQEVGPMHPDIAGRHPSCRRPDSEADCGRGQSIEVAQRRAAHVTEKGATSIAYNVRSACSDSGVATGWSQKRPTANRAA